MLWDDMKASLLLQKQVNQFVGTEMFSAAETVADILDKTIGMGLVKLLHGGSKQGTWSVRQADKPLAAANDFSGIHHLLHMIHAMGIACKTLEKISGFSPQERCFVTVAVDMALTGKEYVGINITTYQQIIVEINEVFV